MRGKILGRPQKLGFGTTLVLLLLFAPVLLATVGSDVVVSTPAHPMMPFDVHSLVAGEADDKATLSSPAGEAQWVRLSWFEHIVQIFFCYPLISKKNRTYIQKCERA